MPATAFRLLSEKMQQQGQALPHRTVCSGRPVVAGLDHRPVPQKVNTFRKSCSTRWTMSISGVSSSSSLSQSLQTWQAKAQKIETEFQQLGQDLQAGNLSQAQSDFSTLSQNFSGSVQSNSTLSQAFSSLGTALQSGNLSAAQKAYSTLQQDVQQTGADHHHHGGSSSQTTSSSTGSTLSQLFSTLGSALQGGNLSSAQTAYSTLQQNLQQLGVGVSTTAQLASSAVSLLG
jgi:hypothetical protein